MAKDDLISKSELFKEMREFKDAIMHEENPAQRRDPNWNDAVSLVGSAPVVDAVPVVRCRDCKHSIENAKHIDLACERSYDPDFYCAAGEQNEA